MSQVEQTNSNQSEGEKEDFNLKENLKKFGFKDYHKIAPAIENGDLCLRDLLNCNDTDLRELCKEYGIKTVQKNRLINAVKNLQNCKTKSSFTLLTKDEQENIKRLSTMSMHMKTLTEKIETVAETNEKCVAKAKDEVGVLFSQIHKHIQLLQLKTMKAVTYTI